MDRKEALRELLYHRRRQIDPTEIGWPPKSGRGRRTQGLSQAQVAQLLYKTERWYAQLERGEMRSPSPQMLDKVAEVLRMEPHERTTLYLYALGYEPPTPSDPKAGTMVGEAWELAVHTVAGHPASISDLAWNVLACNDEFVRMFPRPPGEEPALPERNLMRWMLLTPEARERHLVGWEQHWAPFVAAQLRAALAAYPDNPDLQELDREADQDPVAGPIYRQHSVAHVHPDGDTRPMRHFGRGAPQLGKVTVCAAEPYSSPGARLHILLFEPGT
ncbi:helix-turn-helix domain-containing protein [Streptomyces canus]|uniref:helix-turn-helix domain-containing protein n=1 Tax=Streptomyces canus TaxID=58343 RepID=UPI002E2B62D0|nr:helix-turn-helix domain-containing protein [Streptomyces canus]